LYGWPLLASDKKTISLVEKKLVIIWSVVIKQHVFLSSVLSAVLWGSNLSSCYLCGDWAAVWSKNQNRHICSSLLPPRQSEITFLLLIKVK